MSFSNVPTTLESEFHKLQREGKCGEYQNNGKKCKNSITDWMPVDPDVPDGERIGACGMHANQVFARLKQTHHRKWQRWEEEYTRKQIEDLCKQLSRVGIKCQLDGYREKRIVLQNPAEFFESLGEWGVLDKLHFQMYPLFGPPTPPGLVERLAPQSQAVAVQ